MTRVQLIKRHTHAGIEYGPDTVIEVDASTAAWLDEHGVIQRQNEAAPATSTTRKRGAAREENDQ